MFIFPERQWKRQKENALHPPREETCSDFSGRSIFIPLDN
ncbi:hypothetical protein LptCag_0630 [Leptospirillum ferriphilum]|uniref:Uncharacterized protein n=1 Tax=Leptospirillum ferriphilum TaxID=178606 RepID=A0A094X661_9BACT|nr:hypothetical protein LptCag_0630 [Leptospirillum ferriphilum]